MGSNVKRFVEFLNNPDSRILICTHATLRFAYDEIDDDSKFDDVMLEIDEFHHVSAADNSVLGAALKKHHAQFECSYYGNDWVLFPG